ncbi:protein phosphatase 2C domain-containing protein [Kovacikia minuta CCNUW1]|uniref:PP2C family serine/threonine-protein phosphatase n=1 Tax=Kovacikia minuta TaxID=2931930 RepID=UPI001CCC88E2|nr:PP2C family serine/threonine-protein phosphatase [Kovacikia minuta]UBF23731.1 protein phosphatase 2C domain-containing protein [Kovacikia minuta CCNUW1]
MPWKAVTRSVIGTSHIQQQLPCQDYGGKQILGDVLIGAIADGAGSAAHAEVGAKLAVTIVLEYLALTEVWLQKRRQSWRSLPHPPAQELATKLFTKIVNKVNLGLRKQAETSGYSIDDLACTLLVLLATPRWVAAMQIGDGFIVVRSKRRQDYQLFFQPDKGEYANQTTFVTSSNALADMQIRILSNPPKFICASTDALERVAIRLSDWSAFPPFFKPLEEYLLETTHPDKDDDYLISFLESDRLNSRTDDDKTLLLGFYE